MAPPPLAQQAPTLVELLEEHSSRNPSQHPFTFLEDTEGEESTVSYGELNRRARMIAASLQAIAAPGERVLLLYPPGLEYIAGFFGCLYAGLVAVPAYPPDPLRLERTLPRLRTVIQDAQASVVLTTSFIQSVGESLFEQAPDLGALRWVATDGLPESAADTWLRPHVEPNTLAFLQYTSGSTGMPKGVMLTHGNLMHNLGLISQAFRLRSDSSSVLWLPPYHDMGLIGGILSTLYAGMRTALMSPLSFLKNPFRWLEALSRSKATVSGGPNFAFDLCVRKVTAEQRQLLDLSHWELAFSGAEPIRPETLERFTRAFAPCGFRREAFYPCYGLAEATLMVSGGEVSAPPLLYAASAASLERNQVEDARPGQPDSRLLVGCGRTLREQEILIVDPESLARCPAGRVGEIWVSGPSVARGYWRKPEETRRIFQASPSDGGGRVYLRTGDLGFLKDGELFVTGRQKDLVIIRGRNHYPQDLEQTAERSHPALRPGCTAAFSLEVEGEERLVLVQEIEVRRAGDLRKQLEVGEAAAAAIRQRLAEVHEVQLHALALIEPGSIPKTSSGKIQRRAAREAFLAGELRIVLQWCETARREEQAPSAPEPAPVLRDTVEPAGLETVEGLQAWLVACVAERFQVPVASMDPSQPVTRYGLDSLAAVELAHTFEKKLGAPLSMELLLRGPSLTELARQLFAQRNAAVERPGPQLQRLPRSGPLPLSYAQQRLWFLEQMEPGSARYNLPAAVRMEGPLDVASLEHSFLHLLRRHESLRTTFRLESQGPVQLISPLASFHLQQVDLSALAPSERQAEVRRLSSEYALRPFSLSEGPLLRAALLRLEDNVHVLLLTLHHIISDGWSMGVLLRELSALYQALRQGTPSPLPELPLQYADFASWQRSCLEGEALHSQLSWWRSHLADAPPSLSLPTDFPRPSLLSSRGASVPLVLPASLSQSLLSLCQQQNVTPFMALLAAFQVLLSRYCGQFDLCVGFPIAHRNHPSLEGLIGFFANTLVLRSRFSPSSSFRQLLSLVRDSTLGAYAHQDVPFDKLVESLNPPRDPGRSPLFQVMFSLRDTLQPDLDGTHLRLHPLEVETQTSLFELSLALEATPEGFAGQLQFNTDLFTPATASRMSAHYVKLLEGLVAHPEQHLADVPLLTSDERHLLLEELSGTPPLSTSHCLHHLFEAQVARGPEATALVAGTTRLSYGELNRRANQLAHFLRARGAGPDVPVGICLQRTADLVVGLLAILKAGAAWLPLDPSYPLERLTYSLEDARAPLLLTQDSLRHLLPASGAGLVCIDSDGERISREPLDNPRTSTGPSHLAYILYTSGSTGRPKGVAIEHHSAVILIRWALDCFTAEQLSGVLAATSICFDLSVFELFAPLSIGGTILLADNALALPSLPAAHEVTLVNTVPSAIAELARTRGIPSSVRTLNLAGEPLPGSLARALYALPSVQHVFNLYGPTEDTTYSTFSLVPRDGASEPTIGRPLPGTRVYLLDSRLQPVPPGVPGELHLSGSGLARGYFNRPELTAERFIPDPFSGQPGARLYKTGDLARFLPDGNLEYLGRIDQQVKVRGFRIELGEIESVLLSQPEVLQAVVLAREDVPGDKRLVAYAVAAPGTRLDASTLRRRLERTLPGYMVPSAFVPLEALPLTPNGKIDRKALPPPESHHLARREFIPPRTGLEQALARIWRELLKVDAVGVQDNFFELGGHSLLVTQAVSRILDTLQVELPVRAFFEAPTLEALALRVEAALGSRQARPGPRPVPRPPSGGLPLSYAQQRLWFLEQMEPGSARYNLPAAVRMEGPLDVASLEQSFLHLVRRHESLRTTFRLESQGPVQLISPLSSFHLQQLDLSALAPCERQAEVRRLSSEYALRPFHLSEGPLLRAALLRLEDNVHVLLLTLHHIISDGWSMGVLLRELSALYQAFRQGTPSPLAELPLQYADFASWQRSFLQGEALLSQLSWWRSHLAGAPPSLSLPTDFPRPSVPSSRGASVPLVLPASLSQSLLSLCQQQNVTPFMALLAAFQVLLSRYCGQFDLCVGFPIAHRNHPSLEGLIGFFANTLVLRSRFSPSSSFRQLLSLVRDSTLGAYAHQDVPFDKLVESLNPPRDPGRSPLFQVMFSLQNAPLPELALAELRLRPLESSSQTAKFELLLDLTETREGFTGILEYSTDLFTADTVSCMAEHFLQLLEDAVAHPERRIEQLCEPIVPKAALLQRQDSPQTGAHLPASKPHVSSDSLTDLHHSLTHIWKEVLALEHVDIHDNFFSLGGNSISAILVLARLQDMGLSLKPEQIFQHPTIAELVPLMTQAREVGEQGRVSGELPLTPIQRWLLESWEPQAHHFNQAVMLEVREELKPELLEKALRVLVEHHDALRLRFTRDGAVWRQENAAPTGKTPLRTVDLSGLEPGAQAEALARVAEEVQGGFELAEGHLLKAVLFHRGPGRTGRLLLVIHHLGVDGVSWRTLLEDLEKVYGQLERGEEAAPGAKTTSFKAWAERLEAYAKTPEVQGQLGYWEEQGREPVAGLPVDKAGGANTVASEERVTVGLEEEETRALLQEVPGAYGARLDEVLLAALAEALGRWTGQARVRVELEGHGRETLFEEVDLSRTVGWFTALYPVVLEAGRDGAGEGLRAVKERLRRVPMKGLGYGLLRYSGGDEVVRRMKALPQAEVVFNYLGQFDTPLTKEPLFRPTREEVGPVRSTRGTRPHLLEVNGLVFERRLELTWSYSQHLHERATIEQVARDFISSLRRLIANRKREQLLPARLGELVQSTLREQRMMGMALRVELDGGRRFQVAEGTSDPSGTPYTLTTRIGIGSLTKLFTAVLILQLVEEGRVSLDSTVDTWLPWLQRGGAITVRALLAHTSGLPDYLPRLSERGGLDTPWAPRALVELAAHEPPVPRGHYSNTNSIVLGLLIEALTGRTWEEELSQRILQPLGLSRTGPLTRAEDLAGAWKRSTDGWKDLRHAWHPSIGWAAGGMGSSAEELAVFGRALFSGALFKHPATLEAMRTYAVRGNPERTGCVEHEHGLCLQRFHLQGLDMEGHLGTRPGYSAVLFHDARTRALVVATANTHGALTAFAGAHALDAVRRAAPSWSGS